VTWDGAVNFAAYAEVEAASNYATAAGLESYRAERLEHAQPYVDFLRSRDVPSTGLRVVDVGAGSSAFLYALEEAGLLDAGVGIELSASRHEFAERWRADQGYQRVVNVLGDFATVALEAGSFDLLTVLDDTYLLLRPESASYPTLLLDAAKAALKPGGLFMLDFRNDAALLTDDDRSFWHELPESNAFKYALYRQRRSPDGLTVRNESIYIGRDLTETRKVEVTEICDAPSLAATIAAAGFRSVAIYEDLAMHPFDAGRSKRAVVLAER
jgi:hypothetical protein